MDVNLTYCDHLDILNILKHYVVHLKVIESFMSIIPQKRLNEVLKVEL